MRAHSFFDFGLSPRVKALLNNYVLMLALYSLSRICFLIFNRDRFEAAPLSQIAKSFFYGVYFDNATVAILFLPIALISLLPFAIIRKTSVQKAIQLLFVALHFPLFVAHMCDIEYFKFTGARMTIGVTAMAGDIENQIGQFFVNYWHIASLCVIAFIAMWKLYRRTPAPIAVALEKTNAVSSVVAAQILRQSETHTPKAILNYFAVSFVTLLALFLSVRGGFQSKPLQPSYAFIVADNDLAILALNSTFTILKSNPKDSLKKINYFASDEEAESLLLKPTFDGPRTNGAKTPQNIVIIIIESGATEFWGIANNGQGYTPFLDSIAAKGLFFRNSFANGRKSIEALPAIILGMPALMEHPLAKSRYQFNQWHGLGEAVAQKNYDTSFYQGSEKGSMNFDAIAKLGGVKNYFSMTEYPNPKDYDGFWGIFDEPYLQYYASELSKKTTPFLSMVFTLSSHQPYTIPPQHKDQYKKGPTPMHESVGYVDDSIRQFFESASKEPWYNDTLFIITGDHTQMSPSIDYQSDLGRHMVPILFYSPGGHLEKANTDKTVQHADIFPTIVDYLGIKNAQTNLFGHSIWQDDPGRAIFFQNGVLHSVHGKKVARYDQNRDQASFLCFDDPNHAAECTPEPAEAKALVDEAKAYLQYFNNGMIKNSIYRQH